MNKILLTGTIICFNFKINHFLKIDDRTKLTLIEYQKSHPELADPSEFEIFPVGCRVAYQNTKKSCDIEPETDWTYFRKISDLSEYFDGIREGIKREMTNLAANSIKQAQKDIIRWEANCIEVLAKVDAAKTIHDLINLINFNLD